MLVNFFYKNGELKTDLLIFLFFVGLIALEYSTSPRYVVGYLYTIPILLASLRLSRRATLLITIVAVVATLLDLLRPGVTIITVANRLTAVVALVITAVLAGLRRQRYEQVISYQKQQLRMQKQLANMREDFITTLTQELKTPLLGAIEVVDSLQADRFGEIVPEQLQVLQLLEQSQRNSLNLLEMMLDVYHNDTQGLILRCFPVNLVEIIREAISNQEEQATSRNVQVNFEIKNNLTFAWTMGDARQLQRVAINLLTNAINYARRDGEVKILLETSTRGYIVNFLDDGLGIPEDELPDVFDRFYQGRSDRHGLRLGLGLYLSRQIVQAHGGKIWVENRAEGGGKFSFELPSCQVSA